MVSPYGLAIVSYCIFLFAWIFPPGLYTEYIHEPDLMFMDPEVLCFYSACVAAFLCGVRCSRLLGAAVPRGAEGRVSTGRPLLYLLAPLLLAIVYCSGCLLVLGGQINFVALLAAQQGNAIKLANETGEMSKGHWGPSIPALMCVLWWSLYRATQLRLRGPVKMAYYLAFFLGAGIGLTACIATVDRTNLMPIVIGLVVVYLFHRTRSADASVIRLALTGGIAGAGAMGTFLLLSFLRGALAINVFVTSLLGYTIVSYNRMSALLAGVMHYACEGRGVHISEFLLEDKKIDSIFHLAHHFGWPDAFGLWLSEFASTMAAGLNPGYIWSGAFGYIYSDIGWWAPAYLFIVGFLAGYLWSKLTKGTTVGLVLYPWIGYSILIWCGPNIVFAPTIARLFEFTVLLSIYDRLLLRLAPSVDGAGMDTASARPLIEPTAGPLARGIF
jgi:hypothetical protein